MKTQAGYHVSDLPTTPVEPIAYTSDETIALLRIAPGTDPNNQRRRLRKLVEHGDLHVVGGTVDKVTGRPRRPIDWTFSRVEVEAYVNGTTPEPVTADDRYLRAVQ